MKARAPAARYPGHQALHRDLLVTFGLCPLSFLIPLDSPSPGLPAPPLTPAAASFPSPASLTPVPTGSQWPFLHAHS